MQLIVRSDLQPIATKLGLVSGNIHRGLPKVLGAVGGILESSTRRRIAETKTDPDGKQWAELRPATLKAKTSRSGRVRGSVLVDYGNLMRSITHEVAKDSVIVGSVMTYAVYLQEGSDKRNLPARRFLGLSAEDYRDIDELLDDFLNGLIGV